MHVSVCLFFPSCAGTVISAYIIKSFLCERFSAWEDIVWASVYFGGRGHVWESVYVGVGGTVWVMHEDYLCKQTNI